MRVTAVETPDGQRRVTQIFQYLTALNQVRNPVKRLIDEQQWTLWLQDLPDHPTIRRGVVASRSQANVESHTASADEGYVLKVARPTLTPVPAPPPHLVPWLRDGWQHPDGAVVVHSELRDPAAREVDDIIRFEDDPQRTEILMAWKEQRERWCRAEKPARDALKLFERLYELYGQIERESERVELVLGDGILNWRLSNGGINHPILLQRLQLHFDPQVPEFTFAEADYPVELYSALLRTIPEIDGRVLVACRRELELGDYHPLNGDATSAFLRRIVAHLAPQGEFVGDQRIAGSKDHPRLGRWPLIFLRSRSLGFATALDAVLEDMQHREELPVALLNIAGVESLPPLDAAERHGIDGNDDEHILLSKPANREQLQIAQRLERHGCVLVQGPPGTGKTHTIANLVGHLLAQGKRVLVTSHTAKALRVVRSQVVEELQPLCVRLLDSDADSREQLKNSIEAIVKRLASADAPALRREADTLQSARARLIGDVRQARQQLVSACADEYRALVLAGQQWTPSDAARFVAGGRGHDDWIPGPVVRGAPLPLSTVELAELYRTNAAVTVEDEEELTRALPPIGHVINPADFARLIEERTRLLALPLDVRQGLWRDGTESPSAEYLEALAAHLQRAVTPIGEGDPWRLTAIDAGRRGGTYREAWDQLIAQIEAVRNLAAHGEETLLRHGPVLASDMPHREQEHILVEIITHLENGGTLGRFTLLTHRTWKRLLSKAQVSSGEPETIEHVHALLTLVRLHLARHELVARWERQMTPRGGPTGEDLGAYPEEACAQYIQPIMLALDWHKDVWAPLEAAMERVGFRWCRYLAEMSPNHAPHGDLLRLHQAVVQSLETIFVARANAARMREVQRSLSDAGAKLAAASVGSAQAHIAIALREAHARGDVAAYHLAFDRYLELQQRRSDLDVRRSLLKSLEGAAPAWAAAIRERRQPHDQSVMPGDAERAWRWRQYHDELQARAETSLVTLQQRIEHLSSELRRTTAELVDRRAWAAQVERTHLRQRQALMGWLQTVRKIGRGTGKRVPRLQAEARALMAECRTAVPVWIMPLARVVDNFDPRKTPFDVVIIDEASQSDAMALIAMYMGKQVVVVGDHEQVSPDAVGQDMGEVQHLIDEHLQGIPNAALYDGQLSVYDLAMQSFGGLICLREHFRSVPDIIQFSNDLSYGGQIKPLRDPSSVGLTPHVIPYRVEAKEEAHRVNRDEALTVASLMVAATEQAEYKGKTFGVISLVGEEQAREIERLLRQKLSPVEYERRQIVCGNAAQFQGDERDVMWLSMVDTPRGGPLALRESGQRDMWKKRYNVAVSRARDQLWVVHSIDPELDLKPGDIRRRLIQHARDPHALARRLERAEARVESEFERQVLRHLETAGYCVTPQWQVGYYRIDLVVEGTAKRLAIECDGDRFHPHEKLQEDMERQAILERLGWTFVRIRGSEFFRDPDRAMRAVYERLDAMGISPLARSMSHDGTEPAYSDVQERVVHRAFALRQEWLGALDEVAAAEPESAASTEVLPRNGRLLMAPVVTQEPIPFPVLRQNRPVAANDGHYASHYLPARLSQPVAQTAMGGQVHRRIQDVTDEEIIAEMLRHVPRVGLSIEREALIRKTATGLGFQRLGAKVRSRLEECLAEEERAKRLKGNWNKVWRPME